MDLSIRGGVSQLPSPHRRVVVVQRILPHYRVAFFDALHIELARKGIQLEVIYGQHEPGSVPQSVRLERAWTRYVPNRYIRIIGHTLVWQPVTRLVRGADLMIVEHAARLMGNYPLMLRRWLGGPRLAFWGHGANFQTTQPNSITERFKRVLTKQVDWWFAYTESSLAAVRSAGFPPERITVVQNAIDDTELHAGLQAVTARLIEETKRGLGITSENVALYCGGMYPDKRLDFLLEACVRVRQRVPDLEVVFVGSGPDQHRVEAACAQYPWMHYVGPVFGAERARFFAISRVLLMPGPVGLAVVDSFVAGLPLFTTDIFYHGPEIAYLKHGVNGVMTRFDIDAYAATVAHYLNRPGEMEQLRKGCQESARVYTLENMVRNFAAGVENCLTAGRR